MSGPGWIAVPERFPSAFACRGCGHTWPAVGECGCTCADESAPGYLDWVSLFNVAGWAPVARQGSG